MPAVIILSLLQACGGSSGGSRTPDDRDDGGAASRPPAAAELTLGFQQTKEIQFTWTDVENADFYRVQQNTDGDSGFTQVGEDIPQGVGRTTQVVPLYERVNAQYLIQSCNSHGCTSADVITMDNALTEAIGYIKAGDPGYEDYFGGAVKLSGDGSVLAIAAAGEDSPATGIDSDESDNSSNRAGAVYIFERSADNQWSQQAYIKANTSDDYDQFGTSMDMSADGTTLAVGAFGEDGGGTGVNGDDSDNSVSDSGAAYIFFRGVEGWVQQAYIKSAYPTRYEDFGSAVSLSADGNTLAVGAKRNNSNATGINGDESDMSAANSGAVYIFSRTNAVWSRQAFIKASNTRRGTNFGRAVSLSADGDTLAASAWLENSSASGVNGDQTDVAAYRSGAVYMFMRNGTEWSQEAYIKASSPAREDRFGAAVALSADGGTLAVSATGEDSSATGLDGDQSDNSALDAGAVYIFTRGETDWRQEAYLKAGNTGREDQFGFSLSLTADGNKLAVGATGEDGGGRGVDSDDTAQSENSGAVYVFDRSGGAWRQRAYLKASNTGASDSFGSSVSFDSDGRILAASALTEAGNSAGVNGAQDNDKQFRSGATYLY
ncbi:integrin [Exilibacterium tricleocarpae]|uniref:integrin n=1 Tax=Exilibacterium tricleocarpae TaxID=2591008 RepID=UPI0015D19285|nr:integrin [Exilibacterium tricleocarpae]